MTRRLVRDVWQTEVLRTHLIGEACRVLLLHMATARDSQGRHLMTETGRIRVPRERLADDLAVNPKRITDRITEATRAGLLIKVGGGHNGQTSQYTAQVVNARKVPAEPVPTAPPPSLARLVKVPAHKAPTPTGKPVPTPAAAERVGTGRTDPIRARTRPRTTSGTQAPEPAPDGTGLPEPHHAPNSSSNKAGATPAPIVATSPWVPTNRQPAERRTA